MHRPLLFAAICALSLSIGGCAAGKDQDASAAKPAPKAVEATDCGAERLDSFVNQQASPDVLSQIKKTVGHDRIRVLDPKSVVTMDFQSDRLNVDTNADGLILRLRCG